MDSTGYRRMRHGQAVRSHPVINACITEDCYESFGGMGSRAKVYGNRNLLSPRGFNRHFLAHEWSHDELRTRLAVLAWWHLPQWLDEGLAVAISAAPEHSAGMPAHRPDHPVASGG